MFGRPLFIKYYTKEKDEAVEKFIGFDGVEEAIHSPKVEGVKSEGNLDADIGLEMEDLPDQFIQGYEIDGNAPNNL